MTLILKKGATKEDLRAVDEKLFPKNKANTGFDAAKYNGTVKFTEDALLTQKQLRDEWERNIG